MSDKIIKGKQKIEIKEIENEDEKLVTFSKRKSGVINKASELSILCGADVGFVVFTPTGKPISFGRPSIETINNRVLHSIAPVDNIGPLLEAHCSVRINQFAEEYNGLSDAFDVEKSRAKLLNQMKSTRKAHGWWETPTKQLDKEQLKQMEAILEGDLGKIYAKIKEKTMTIANSSSLPSQFHNSLNLNAGNQVGPPSIPPIVDLSSTPLAVTTSFLAQGVDHSSLAPERYGNAPDQLFE